MTSARLAAALAAALLAAPALAGGASDAFVPAIASARAAQGLNPLAADPVLTRAAQAHADDMAQRGYFSHTGADGSQPAQRAARAGCRSGYIAENIAYGIPTAQAAFDGWMNSRGHRENIERQGFGAFGVGQAGGYWVMLFSDAC